VQAQVFYHFRKTTTFENEMIFIGKEQSLKHTFENTNARGISQAIAWVLLHMALQHS